MSAMATGSGHDDAGDDRGTGSELHPNKSSFVGILGGILLGLPMPTIFSLLRRDDSLLRVGALIGVCACGFALIVFHVWTNGDRRR